MKRLWTLGLTCLVVLAGLLSTPSTSSAAGCTAAFCRLCASEDGICQYSAGRCWCA